MAPPAMARGRVSSALRLRGHTSLEPRACAPDGGTCPLQRTARQPLVAPHAVLSSSLPSARCDPALISRRALTPRPAVPVGALHQRLGHAPPRHRTPRPARASAPLTRRAEISNQRRARRRRRCALPCAFLAHPLHRWRGAEARGPQVRPAPPVAPSLTWRRHDWERTGRFAIWGTFIMGPILHNWYKGLEKLFPGQTLVQSVRILPDASRPLTARGAGQEDRTGAEHLRGGDHSGIHGHDGADVGAAMERDRGAPQGGVVAHAADELAGAGPGPRTPRSPHLPRPLRCGPRPTSSTSSSCRCSSAWRSRRR